MIAKLGERLSNVGRHINEGVRIRRGIDPILTLDRIVASQGGWLGTVRGGLREVQYEAKKQKRAGIPFQQEGSAGKYVQYYNATLQDVQNSSSEYMLRANNLLYKLGIKTPLDKIETHQALGTERRFNIKDEVSEILDSKIHGVGIQIIKEPSNQLYTYTVVAQFTPDALERIAKSPRLQDAYYAEYSWNAPAVIDRRGRTRDYFPEE